MPSVTFLANRPLRWNEVPGTARMGQTLVTAQKEDEDTIVVPSDGVGRITGLENRDTLYRKSNADSETRRLRNALERLRVPTLILFPRVGELTELHMQQALYDMNVLATPLTATMALNRDNRSPYNTIVKTMLADKTANLKEYGLDRDLSSMVRFVKIAVEGWKVAEKAGASGSMTSEITPQAATDLTYFWSVLTSSMGPEAFKVKDNMATGAPGITALALVAHELFFGGAAQWSSIEKASAIRKIGGIDWSRTKIDEAGQVELNKTWADLGLLMLKPDKKGNIKAVMVMAGANNSRAMTGHLLKVIGLERSSSSLSTSSEGDVR